MANTWDNIWHTIQLSIEEKLQKERKDKYQTLNNKLKILTKQQETIPHKPHTFYPRVINNTDITFTNNETALLQKGLKYNTHPKHKNWVQNLALEAETAISQLPTSERDVYRKLVADRINTLTQKNPTHKTP